MIAVIRPLQLLSLTSILICNLGSQYPSGTGFVSLVAFPPPPTPNPASRGPASLASVHVLSRLWLSWLCAAPSARAVCRGTGGAVEGMAALQLEKGFFPGLSSSRCRPFLCGWFWGVGRFGEVWQRAFWTWWEGVEDVVSVSPPGHSTRAGCGSVVTRGRREWLPVDFIVLRF